MAPRKTETGCRPDQLFDAWAIEPERMQRMVALVRAADLVALRAEAAANPSEPKPSYTALDGVAVIHLAGPLTKYQTSFQAILGGTSTLEARAAMRAANADASVRSVLLHIESPGGTVGGTAELYDDIRASKKPVHAHIEDLGASAAMWIASAAKSISANQSAMVGSIGTYTAIEDTSGAYEKAGIKVHVVSSGGVKGGGVDGAPVSDAYLAETQTRIDAITDLFIEAVSKGRGLPRKQVAAMADGRLHLAAAAKELGLIDRIASFDEAFQIQARKAMDEQTLAAQAAELAELKAKVAEQAAQVKAANDQLAAVAREKQVAAMAAQLSAFKNLPNVAALAEVVLSLTPEFQAAALTAFKAWDAQSKTGALFAEIGTSAGGNNAALNLSGPITRETQAEWEKAADAMVAAKQAPDRATAMKSILLAQAKGGN